MEIRVEEHRGPTAAESDVEIVERKGIGHPDTICDGVMEEVSRALCAAYLDRFGRVLHHNCDKGLLIAGQTELRLGGGRVLDPMRIVIGDRATAEWKGSRIDVPGIALQAGKAWFRRHLARVDPDRDVRWEVDLRPGAAELAGIFDRDGGILAANDTSAVVGFAPLTETELLTLEAERFLNSPEFKAQFPETGEDVKVMAVRFGRRTSVTVAMPLADHLHRTVQGLREVTVRMCSRIGEPVDRPWLTAVQVGLSPGASLSDVTAYVLGEAREELDRIPDVCRELAEGRHRVY